MNNLEQLKHLNTEINSIIERLNINITEIDIALLRKKIIDAYDLSFRLQEEIKTTSPEIEVHPYVEMTEQISVKNEEIIVNKTEVVPEPIKEEMTELQEVTPHENPQDNFINEVVEQTEIDEKEIIPDQTEKNEPELTLHEFVEKELANFAEAEITEEATESVQAEAATKADNEIKKEFSEDLFNAAQEQIRKKSVLEKFSRHEPSINEKIASNKTQIPLADSVAKGPITDISKAITLNMKLSFIKELYGGDQKEYTKLINFLTKCQNYTEAKLYIQAEQEKYQSWQQKTELVEQLMSLITRRFRM